MRFAKFRVPFCALFERGFASEMYRYAGWCIVMRSARYFGTVCTEFGVFVAGVDRRVLFAGRAARFGKKGVPSVT